MQSTTESVASLSVEQIVFVTGRLAAPLVRRTVEELASRESFRGIVQELPISVAALMTIDWIAERLQIPESTTRIILPGYCCGDLAPLEQRFGIPVECGPKDIRQLSQYFRLGSSPIDLEHFDIQILAEINHAPALRTEDLENEARRLVAEGADLIDLGCTPGSTWLGIGDAVRRLSDLGIHVSVDSWDLREVSLAVAAGAELVLSVNSSNRQAALDWGVEVVAVPDSPHHLESLYETAQWLNDRGVAHRLDPILEPIGMGFAASLLRYHATRVQFPDAKILMGVGNLTELSDVDSAGVNFVLAALCQEWSVQSVLTTEVINWARSSVRELDRARRIVAYAFQQHTIPKNIDAGLVMLRDPTRLRFAEQELVALAAEIKDRNYRIFLSEDAVHLLGARNHWHGSDPFEVFDQMLASDSSTLTAAHAFYLGYEMCKAELARRLDKNYVQDEALEWGMLSRPEPPRHRLSKWKTQRNA